MGEIRRGRAAIEEAAKGSGGSFSPYLPSIYWNEDGAERFILLLNDVEDLPRFDMIQFIEDENEHMQEAVAKTDQFFGERKDGFVEQWDAKANMRNIAIAVELEAVVEVVKNKRKPRGFEVKTIEYERRVLDDDGEPTEETEEVTAPAVGYISQSPNNFFNVISNYDANEAPVTETALKVTRIGMSKDTSYTLVGYDEMPIDLSNLTEYIDGVSYLKEELDDLIEEIADVSDEEAGLVIGKLLLDKKEEELVDDDRYQTLLAGVHESMDKFGTNKKAKKKEKAEPARSRASQRKTTREKVTEREETTDPDDEPASDPDPTEEVTPKAKAKAKPKAKKAASKTAEKGDRMTELRARAAERAAARK
jgi:hypothetical protein